jgi:8-oxo-dGTP pyrophosphatase MutT (NUDIX family)
MLGGSFILMFNKSCNSTLLGYRSSNTNWNPNTWCPFGGTIEDDEIPLETAQREYYEETGISPESYTMTKNPIYIKEDEDSSGHLHQMFLYLGILLNGIEPVINDEHEEYKWVELSDLLSLNLHPIILDMLTCDRSVEAIKDFLSDY